MACNRHSSPLSLFVILASCGGHNLSAAETEFNTDFLLGVDGTPAVFLPEVQYPAGEYVVDVRLNDSLTGRTSLAISEMDQNAGNICLSPEWLQHAGIFFNPNFYTDTFDVERGCYVLERNEHTQIRFDLGTQTVNFIIPQAFLPDRDDSIFWDYGTNGLKLSYNVNFNKKSGSALNTYAGFDTNVNLGEWVLSSRMNAAQSESGSEFATNDLLLSTALSGLRGDLLFGLSHAQTELFSDFGFYGVSVRSNSRMRPWNFRGYAPLITGVAPSTSRITIDQDGFTIYSKVVPAGPYQLNDVSPVGNSDLLVTVEDDNGVKTSSIYPVTILPSLLRPGEYNYRFAVGEKSFSNVLKDAFSTSEGPFLLASFDYGLPSTTINMASILHNRYQALGVGMTQPLGQWGVFSSGVNFSNANYNDATSVEGGNFSFKYAKSFTNKTDLQLLTYRYQGAGYREFSGFDPSTPYNNKQEKVRYEARVSHRLDSNVYLSSSLWQQSYWGNNKDATGANLSASKALFDVMSLYVNGNYSRGESFGLSQNDYSVSVGVSVPFDVGGLKHYGSSSVAYSGGAGSFNTSVSASVNNRFNYALNANTDMQNSTNTGVNLGYVFDTAQTTMGISQGRDHTTYSGSLSGSAVVTAESGLMFTKESSNSIAIAKIPGIQGVTFNGSMPTNEDGEAVVYLSSYHPTSIDIDTNNVPDDIELLDSSHSFVPTDKAIIYREFKVANVLRYILRVKDAEGNIMAGGNVVTDSGTSAGFIARNGVLLMDLSAKPEWVTITKQSNQSCNVDVSTLQANTNLVQEVRCE